MFFGWLLVVVVVEEATICNNWRTFCIRVFYAPHPQPLQKTTTTTKMRHKWVPMCFACNDVVGLNGFALTQRHASR